MGEGRGRVGSAKRKSPLCNSWGPELIYIVTAISYLMWPKASAQIIRVAIHSLNIMAKNKLNSLTVFALLFQNVTSSITQVTPTAPATFTTAPRLAARQTTASYDASLACTFLSSAIGFCESKTSNFLSLQTNIKAVVFVILLDLIPPQHSTLTKQHRCVQASNSLQNQHPSRGLVLRGFAALLVLL